MATRSGSQNAVLLQTLGTAAIVVGAVTLAWRAMKQLPSRRMVRPRPLPKPHQSMRGMVLVPAGHFTMGYDWQNNAQWPAHNVRLDAFWIDTHEVTNREFARFVAATSYVTSAQRAGRSWVFDPIRTRWLLLCGACWERPSGPGSDLRGAGDKPVVQVSWEDAAAYCKWARKRLPTEAEWERSALGDVGAPPSYATPAMAHRGLGVAASAIVPHAVDGIEAAKLGKPNALGVVSMGSNVWEWCSDWYAEDYYQYSPPENPRGPHRGKRRVQRGGSWLQADHLGSQIWTRERLAPTSAHNFAGFRCVRSA